MHVAGIAMDFKARWTQSYVVIRAALFLDR
jgi:hypothetical protein